MCNCVICSRPCQSNAESAGMPRLETLVTRPYASNRLSHVTWVFRITLRSSVSKHLRISTPCRNVSFTSAIPSLHLVWIIALVLGITPSVKPLGYCTPIADHACLLEYSSVLPSLYLFDVCSTLPVIDHACK